MRAALDRQSAQGEQEVKARALAAVQLLQEAADRRGLSLKSKKNRKRGDSMATSQVSVLFPCPVEQVWRTVTDLSCTTWRSDLKGVEGGTQLTCTETVMARHWWMRPFVPGYLKRQQKRYLKDLRKKLLK